MCGGGSGAKEQQQLEDQRQSEIQSTVDAIRGVFGDQRQQQLYQRQQQSVLGLNRSELDRQHANAERRMRFQLAGQGLGGGSVGVDQQAELGRLYDQGLASAQQRALAASNALRDADEQAQFGLISQAQSGLDAGTAVQRALSARQSTANLASQQGQVATLGNAFANFAQAQGQRDVTLGRQSAGYGQPTGARLGSSSSFGGRVT